jgi:hypothetical protein
MPAANFHVPISRELELEKIVGLGQAAELSGESVDQIKRHRSQYIIRLSERRLGMRLKHALRLDEPPAT